MHVQGRHLRQCKRLLRQAAHDASVPIRYGGHLWRLRLPLMAWGHRVQIREVPLQGWHVRLGERKVRAEGVLRRRHRRPLQRAALLRGPRANALHGGPVLLPGRLLRRGQRRWIWSVPAQEGSGQSPDRQGCLPRHCCSSQPGTARISLAARLSEESALHQRWWRACAHLGPRRVQGTGRHGPHEARGRHQFRLRRQLGLRDLHVRRQAPGGVVGQADVP
mmetsp:Transcript_80536/g.222792  ORF Transcript_80536/g.222792 Transcript_80536/m.222792 type:complete len:220 (+) Transcript_80536:138-797(+)